MDIVVVFIGWYVGECAGIFGWDVGDIVGSLVRDLVDVVDDIFDG